MALSWHSINDKFLKPQFEPGQCQIQGLCLCAGAVFPPRAVRHPLRAYRKTAPLVCGYPRFEPFRGCPRNAELAAHTGRQAIQGPPETAPPQKPLNDASGVNRLRHISSTVITDLVIFRLRPLRFLLLRFSRKSFAKPQKPFRKFPTRNANQPPSSGF